MRAFKKKALVDVLVPPRCPDNNEVINWGELALLMLLALIVGAVLRWAYCYVGCVYAFTNNNSESTIQAPHT